MSLALPLPGIALHRAFTLPYPARCRKVPRVHLIPPTPEHPYISPSRFSNQRRTEAVFQGKPTQTRAVTPPKTWSYKPYTRKQTSQTPTKARVHGKENVGSSTRTCRSAALLADALLDEHSGRKPTTTTLDVTLTASELEFYSSAQGQDVRHEAVFGHPTRITTTGAKSDFAKPSREVLKNEGVETPLPPPVLRWTVPPPSSNRHQAANDSPGERQRRKRQAGAGAGSARGSQGALTERLGAFFTLASARSHAACEVRGSQEYERLGDVARQSLGPRAKDEGPMFIIGDSDDEEEDVWEDCPL